MFRISALKVRAIVLFMTYVFPFITNSVFNPVNRMLCLILRSARMIFSMPIARRTPFVDEFPLNSVLSSACATMNSELVFVR